MTNTVAITVTDVNDQTPTFCNAITVNSAEGATTAVDSFTITDTDTTGLLLCRKWSGRVLWFLLCNIPGSTLTVSWDASCEVKTQTDDDVQWNTC